VVRHTRESGYPVGEGTSLDSRLRGYDDSGRTLQIRRFSSFAASVSSMNHFVVQFFREFAQRANLQVVAQSAQ
jgi:hypothetical protein